MCDKLLEKGWRVLGIDDLSNGSLDNLSEAFLNPRFSFQKFDLAQDQILQNLDFEEDVLLHLASNKIPRFGGRINTLTRNLQSGLAVLERARQSGATVVFSSTSDVYGKNSTPPFSESHDSVTGSPSIARWSYAVSKLHLEHLLYAYKEEFGLDFTIMRLFGSYGPRHARSWLGGPQSVFIDAAMSGEPLQIHGNGEQTRSFCFVDDTVEGIYRVVETSAIRGMVVNLGNNEEVSIKSLGQLTLELMAISDPARLQMVPYATFGNYEDVKKRVPDLTLARDVLGFVPQVSLEEGMRKTIEWHKKNPKK